MTESRPNCNEFSKQKQTEKIGDKNNNNAARMK